MEKTKIRMFNKPIVGFKVIAQGRGSGKAVIVVNNQEELWLAVNTALNLADVSDITIERVIEVTVPKEEL